MYDLVIDLEIDVHGDRSDPSAYNEENILSAIGWVRTDTRQPGMVWTKALVENPNALDEFKADLAGAQFVVMHNAKFDLAWMRSVDIPVTNKVICTMVSEYILSRGIRSPLSLKALAKKYGVTEKLETLGEALEEGLNFSDMPEDIARDYLYSDLLATLEVYEKQSSIFSRGDSTSLIPIRDMMCEFTSVLTDIEMAGSTKLTRIMRLRRLS